MNFQENRKSNFALVLSFNHQQSTIWERLSSIVKIVENRENDAFDIFLDHLQSLT